MYYAFITFTTIGFGDYDLAYGDGGGGPCWWGRQNITRNEAAPVSLRGLIGSPATHPDTRQQHAGRGIIAFLLVTLLGLIVFAKAIGELASLCSLLVPDRVRVYIFVVIK